MSIFNKDEVSSYPGYGKYNASGGGLYRRFLNQNLRERSPEYVGDVYRTQAFRDIGNQQSQANEQADRDLASSGFGGLSSTSGLSSSVRARSAAAAPYGEANLASRELARRAMMEVGRERSQENQRRANWWATLTAPGLQQRALDIQEAFGLAGFGPGGFAGGFGQGLGSSGGGQPGGGQPGGGFGF